MGVTQKNGVRAPGGGVLKLRVASCGLRGSGKELLVVSC